LLSWAIALSEPVHVNGGCGIVLICGARLDCLLSVAEAPCSNALVAQTFHRLLIGGDSSSIAARAFHVLSTFRAEYVLLVGVVLFFFRAQAPWLSSVYTAPLWELVLEAPFSSLCGINTLSSIFGAQ
jgi:hypothetical protein